MKQEFPKKVSRVIPQEPAVPKGQKYNEFMKMKAPSEEDMMEFEEAKESEDDQVIREEMKNEWTEDHLVKAYKRSKMKKFALKDPVTKALKVEVQGEVQGPIAHLPPPPARTELEILRAMMDLVRNAGMKPGKFDADNLFDMGSGVLSSSLVA